MSFLGFFKGLVEKAIALAKKENLDEVVQLALPLVKEAAKMFTENELRREFVIKILVSKGVPESIARLALELAVRLLKSA